jgi:hypothetical protein
VYVAWKLTVDAGTLIAKSSTTLLNEQVIVAAVKGMNASFADNVNEKRIACAAEVFPAWFTVRVSVAALSTKEVVKVVIAAVLVARVKIARLIVLASIALPLPSKVKSEVICSVTLEPAVMKLTTFRTLITCPAGNAGRGVRVIVVVEIVH